MKVRTLSRRARAVVGVGLMAAALYGVRRYRAVREVAAALRAGWLYLPCIVPPVMPLPGCNRAAARIARRLLRRRTRVRPGVSMRQVVISEPESDDELHAYLYEPTGRSEPSGALLWIHGGDLVVGHPEQDHELCSGLADQLEIAVLSVDYRLAPDHPFPASHDDCYAALRWLRHHAAALGVDPDRIAVGGASAGGGLAATVAQHAHDDRSPVAFQLLVYPMLDDRTTLRPRDRRLGRIAFTPAMNRYGWSSYLGRRPSFADPGRYAAASRRSNLSGLPAAWIGVGSLDLVHDEAVSYAHRLQDAGVACQLHVEPGMYHGADVGLSASVSSMRLFRERMATALGAGLAGPGRPISVDRP